MEVMYAMFLGAVQGATEFLPVSSSGHLAVGQMAAGHWYPGLSLADHPLAFEILLHLATLLAILVVFRREVAGLFWGMGKVVVGIGQGRLGSVLKEHDGANLAVAVVAGSVPTAILGLLLRDAAVHATTSSTLLGLSFLGCAGLLLASRWWPGGSRRLTWRLALLIGLIQGIAVLPGISRSGVTIVMGLALGLDREAAARFSFLLSLPAIAGAAVLELDMAAITVSGNATAYLFGAAAAFFIGLFALLLLMRLVRLGRLWLFSPYVGAVGVLTLLFL